MADFDSKYSGEQVEALLDQVASGNAGGGGGGGITVETDPIFSASPAAGITEEQIVTWNDLEEMVNSLDADVAQLTNDVIGVQESLTDLDTIRSGAAKGATSVQPDDIKDFVTEGTLADVAFTADYEELNNKPTFKTINGESIVGEGEITIAGGSGEVGPQGPQGDKGDTGVGVQSVAQTTTSNADGGSNVVTVTLTDGTKSTFTVKNGSKGSQGIQGEQGPKGDTGEQGPKGDKGDKGDTGAAGANGTNGTNGKDGADGEDGATFTPSVDSAGNLSWTNNKGLTNPPTVNIKGPKGDKGDAGEGGGGSSGGEDNSVEELDLIVGADLVISELLPNKKYVVYASFIPEYPSLTISSLGGNLSGEEPTIDSFYALIMTDVQSADKYGVEVSLYLPDDGEWRWANGNVTQMKLGKSYEMSIIRHNDYGYPIYYITIAEY